MKIVINESTSGPGVTVIAETLTIDIPDNIGAAPAAAIAKGIADQIRSISAMARGGKHRAFNNTGRLANELAAIVSGAGYDIVPPEGYLEDDDLFGRLVELVPAIQDPTTLQELQLAIEKAAGDLVTVG